MARPIASWPAPRSPVRPSSSPALTENDTGPTPAATPSTTSQTLRRVAAAGVRWIGFTAPPTIMRTSSAGVVAWIGCSPTRRPSRSTTTRSALAKISSSRCDT